MTTALNKFANQLDWNLLRTFMVIVQERSLTLAAHRLAITQPSVSASLRRLEERVQQRLIERGGANSFQVSPAGEALYRSCVELYARVSELPQNLQATQALLSGTITILVSSALHWAELGAAIKAFRSEHPDVNFRVGDATCADVLSALAQKSISFGVVEQQDGRALLQYLRMSDQRMALYGLVAHRSADLASSPLVGLDEERGGAALDAMRGFRRDAGLSGAMATQAASCAAIADLIEAGVGIGPLPCDYACSRTALIELPVAPQPPSLPRWLACRRQLGLSTAEASFLQHLAATGLCTADATATGQGGPAALINF